MDPVNSGFFLHVNLGLYPKTVGQTRGVFSFEYRLPWTPGDLRPSPGQIVATCLTDVMSSAAEMVQRPCVSNTPSFTCLPNRLSIWHPSHVPAGLILYFGFGIHNSTAVLTEDTIELQVTTPPESTDKPDRPAQGNNLSPPTNPFNPFTGSQTARNTEDPRPPSEPRTSHLTINGIDLK